MTASISLKTPYFKTPSEQNISALSSRMLINIFQFLDIKSANGFCLTSRGVHAFHKKHFDALTHTQKMVETVCPIGGLVFVRGYENPTLDETTAKLGVIGRSLHSESRRPVGDENPMTVSLKQWDKAIEGNGVEVDKLLKQGASLPRLINGCSPIYIACKNGNVDMVKLLLRHRSNPLEKNDLSNMDKWSYWSEDYHFEHGAAPIKIAIHKGSLEIVKLLLEQKASLPYLINGRSPIYIACKYGNIDMVKLLLKCGASLLAKNDLRYQESWNCMWWTTDYDYEHEAMPMQIAVQKGNLEIVNFLRENGASIDYFNSIDRTPIYIAVKAEQEEMALYLLKEEVSLPRRDSYGNSLIVMAATSELLKVVQELISRGVSVTDCDKDGRTCLHVAARRNPKILDFLLDNGGKKIINAIWLGETALLAAVEEGHIENVKLLVEAGADLSLKKLENCSGERGDILHLAGKSLEESCDFYRDHPHDKECEKVISNKKAVIEFLEQRIKPGSIIKTRVKAGKKKISTGSPNQSFSSAIGISGHGLRSSGK